MASQATLEMPKLGLGTWGMGGTYERDTSNVTESITAIQNALEVGYRMFDVAELYGEGLTEEIVGKGIAHIPRQEVYLVSKVWKTHLSPDHIRRAIEGSLERLRTDYLDLYLIHWPNPEIPLEPAIQTMTELVHQGLTRSIGVSNFDTRLLKETQTYTRDVPISVNQVEYSFSTPYPDAELLPYCNKHTIKIMAYRPLSRGSLARITSEVVERLAQKYNKTSAQITLNWLIAQGMVPIPKASTYEHLVENFGALDFNLSLEDVELLSKSTS